MGGRIAVNAASTKIRHLVACAALDVHRKKATVSKNWVRQICTIPCYKLKHWACNAWEYNNHARCNTPKSPKSCGLLGISEKPLEKFSRDSTSYEGDAQHHNSLLWSSVVAHFNCVASQSSGWCLKAVKDI